MVHALESTWGPRVLSILRIMTGLVFWQHGVQKMLQFPAARPGPEMFSLSWTAGVLEFVLAPLIIIGLFTRPVAFVLSGLMAFAYFIGHTPRISSRPSTAATWRSCTASYSSISRWPAAAPGASTTSCAAKACACRRDARVAAIHALNCPAANSWNSMPLVGVIQPAWSIHGRIAMLRISLAVACAVSLVVAVGGSVIAQQDPVKARQDLMKLSGKNLASLNRMVRGDDKFDPQRVNVAFDGLAEKAKQLPAMFPPGSAEGSRALAKIWDDPAAWKAEIDRFDKNVAEQRPNALKGVDGVKGAVAVIGKDCGSCHQGFRRPQS
jgi:cytochrome c556/uncharacterized membrane protein YphA (DoxX/SURF4 family)